MIKLLSRKPTALRLVNPSAAKIKIFTARSEERFSRNAETDLVCRLLLEKKKKKKQLTTHHTFTLYIYFTIIHETHTIVIYSLSLHDALPICNRSENQLIRKKV